MEASKQKLHVSTSAMSTTKRTEGNPSRRESFPKSEEFQSVVYKALKGWKRRFLTELRAG